MAPVSYTELRQNLVKYMDEVCDSGAPLVVTRQNARPVVMLSLEEYESMAETLHLLRSPANADRLLRSIKGVGPVVSRTLLADLPELGARPPGKLAALAGLAPFASDSGRRRGERHIRGGRREVRRALYMGALAVARVPGPLRDFAQRLKAKGKPSTRSP